VVGLIPAPVQPFCGHAKLNNQVSGEVLRLNLAPLLPPQPHQGGLIVPHDDPGVGAANKLAAVRAMVNVVFGHTVLLALSAAAASRSRVGSRPAAIRRVAQLRSASGQEDVRAIANGHVRVTYAHGDQG
jgi:hypothetical protein